MMHVFSYIAYSPPPYRPNPKGIVIDVPEPRIRAAAPQGVQEDGVIQPRNEEEPVVEEKMMQTQATDTSQAYVIGLHAVFCKLS